MTSPDTIKRFVLPSGWRNIDAALDWVTVTTREMGGTERQQFGATICAEELLANLLSHDKTAPAAALMLEAGAGRLTLTIEDGGVPFDPTREPERQSHGDLDEAQPGGWGLALVRRFAEDFTYKCNKKGNLVQLSFLP